MILMKCRTFTHCRMLLRSICNKRKFPYFYSKNSEGKKLRADENLILGTRIISRIKLPKNSVAKKLGGSW